MIYIKNIEISNYKYSGLPEKMKKLKKIMD